MRSENTFGVYFTVRKNKNTRGDHSVVAVVSCNNTPERELTIKGSYDINDWDQGAGKPKLHSKPLREFATYLEKVKGKFTAIFQELELNECILSAENIKNHYLGKSEEQARVTMLELTKLAYAKYEKELKPGSLKNYGATNGYIERFCNFKYSAKDIPLRKLDFNFIDDLYSYILSNPIKPNEPCHKTGAMKHMERLKKMVKWAGNKGWCAKGVFAEFAIKIKRKETEYLNWQQLQAVENAVMINPLTKIIQAIFIFCCYTGMAPIDVQTLVPSQLSKDMFGNLWMTYTRVKSEVPAWAPLLDRAKEIVEQFGMEQGAAYRETVFPYISNKVMNDHLKIIGLACGFDFELHPYMARHTFGTTVTTQMGVPVEVTKIMMGHEKIDTTMIYTRVGNPLVLMYMQRVQQRINSGQTMSINGINEEQFMLLLEKIAPQILEKVFTNDIIPKLMEIVHKNPAQPQISLSETLGTAV